MFGHKAVLVQKLGNGRIDFIRCFATGINIKITMSAGVSQALILFCQTVCAAVDVGAAQAGMFITDIQVDENVWPGETLPHIGNVGMFLGGLAYREA